MNIYGIDFTSAPSKRKPIVCAFANYEMYAVHVYFIKYFTDFDQFDAWLNENDIYVAGLDFPFGLPAKLIQNMAWGNTWEAYVSQIASMSMAEYVETLAKYRQNRAVGDKQHLRETDKLAGARSPMMLYGVPVGRMFFHGVPRLLKSGISVLPCHLTQSSRTAIEVYPALVARRFIGKASYKSDALPKQTESQRVAREKIIMGLRSECHKHYGFTLHNHMENEAINDAKGDTLDAILCAVQATWAFRNAPKIRDKNALEGWIADPAVL